MTNINLDNESLKQACCNVEWNDDYNDLIDCGENYYFGGSGGYNVRSNMRWGYVLENGILTYKSGMVTPSYKKFVKRGVRLVLELKKDVQILDVDGEDGSSEENAYSLFLSE